MSSNYYQYTGKEYGTLDELRVLLGREPDERCPRDDSIDPVNVILAVAFYAVIAVIIYIDFFTSIGQSFWFWIIKGPAYVLTVIFYPVHMYIGVMVIMYTIFALIYSTISVLQRVTAGKFPKMQLGTFPNLAPDADPKNLVYSLTYSEKQELARKERNETLKDIWTKLGQTPVALAFDDLKDCFAELEYLGPAEGDEYYFKALRMDKLKYFIDFGSPTPYVDTAEWWDNEEKKWWTKYDLKKNAPAYDSVI